MLDSFERSVLNFDSSEVDSAALMDALVFSSISSIFLGLELQGGGTSFQSQTIPARRRTQLHQEPLGPEVAMLHEPL